MDPVIENRLRSRAAAEGLTIDEYVDRLMVEEDAEIAHTEVLLQEGADSGDYLENAGLEVAKRFRAAVTETLGELAQRLDLGAPRKVRRPEFRDVRIWRVNKFES